MISEDEVRRIAALAKLELGADDLARMQRDLGAILDFVDQIREIETSARSSARSGAQRAPFPGVDSSEPEEPENGARCAPPRALRDDEPRPSLSRDDVAANAPRFLAGHFVVPRILGGGS